MKVAYYYGIGDIRMEEKKVPDIKENEILIKVRACAVCGTDLRIFKFGHFKIPQGTKRVLGHEIAGEIAAVGTNVKGYKVGEKVAVPPNIGCGKCRECMKGKNQLCAQYEAFGISLDGGFQEYMVVPDFAVASGAVFSVPEGLSFEEAALAESFSCVYNAFDSLKTSPGDTVLVIGAGPIGNMHVIINKLAGATKIMVADINMKRLEESEKFGADVIIDTSKQDIVEMVKQNTDGLGADVVITACSVPDLQATALELAATCGRINFFGGLPLGKEYVTLNTNLIHYKELSVLATTGSSKDDFYKTLHILASGRISLKPLISHRYKIENINEAFKMAASGDAMKVFVVNE